MNEGILIGRGVFGFAVTPVTDQVTAKGCLHVGRAELFLGSRCDQDMPWGKLRNGSDFRNDGSS